MGFTTRPFTEEELRGPKDNILNSFSSATTPGRRCSPKRERLEFYGYPADYLESYKAALEKVTRPTWTEWQRSTSIPTSWRCWWWAMGPEIKPGLEELKLGPVETVDITIPHAKPSPKQP